MENKSVCYYCGTIYESELGKCPLCGSTVRAKEEEINRPEPRRRLTEQERKERQKTSKGKYSAQKSKAGKSGAGKVIGKVLLICAMVFLIFAIGIVFFFIGDMIGWWPGLEDRIERHQASVALEKSCQILEVSPEGFDFDAPGKTAELVISVNANCEEVVYCQSGDESVVAISQEAVTEKGEELKSATFIVTAMGAGETDIVITCGDKTVTRPVLCIDPDNYAPIPDCGNEIIFTAFEETKSVSLTGLPEGKTPVWSSEDEKIASVDENGIVTATGKGETTISVEVNGNVVQIYVRCDFEMPLDEGAKIKYSDVTLKVGEKFRLYLYGSDGERITEDVSYEVNNGSLLTIEDGVITPVKKGTTTVKLLYGDKVFECIIRIR